MCWCFWPVVQCLHLAHYNRNFEDTLTCNRSRKSKEDRQCNGNMKEDKGINNDLQNITHQNKVRVTRTPLKSGGELRCSGRVSSSSSTCITRGVTIKRYKLHLIWKLSRTLVCVNTVGIEINTRPFPYQPGYHPETPISARDAVEGLYGSRDDSRDDMEKVMY